MLFNLAENSMESSSSSFPSLARRNWRGVEAITRTLGGFGGPLRLLPYNFQRAALALCVIFTILVSFSQDNALFASKAKINVFRKNFERSGPEEASGVRKIFKQC